VQFATQVLAGATSSPSNLPIRAACALRLAESVASRAIFAERGF
jgi:hypothetical protein